MSNMSLKILFILLNFHVFRKLTIVPALMSLAVYIYIILINFKKIPILKINAINVLMFYYLLFNIYLIIITYLNCDCQDINIGVIRAFFVFPIFYMVVMVGVYGDEILVFLRIYINIILLSALVLIYQLIFGPIEWFGPLFYRAGLPRYFTILGALPTYCIASSFAIIFLGAAGYNKLKILLIYTILVIGMILSLQKTAIPNFILSSAMLSYIIYGKNLFNLKNLIKIIIIALLFFVIGSILFPGYSAVMAKFMGLDFGPKVGWVGYDMQSQIIGRLSSIFGENLEWINIFLGSGFHGMAGVLGFSGKTPHNGFGDYFVSGGIFYLLLYLLILFYSIRRLIFYKNIINRKLYLSLIFFLSIFIINVPFYSGIMINPSLSSIFWIIIGYISILELNGYHSVTTS